VETYRKTSGSGEGIEDVFEVGNVLGDSANEWDMGACQQGMEKEPIPRGLDKELL
jgi:hypothetical protein